MVTRPDITPEKVAAALAVVGGSTAKAAALLGCNDSTVRRHRDNMQIQAAEAQRAVSSRMRRAPEVEARRARRRAWAKDGDWRLLAECLEEDPELFFPKSPAGGAGGPSPAAVAQEAEAKAVCRRCDVRDRCLRWALDRDIRDGVWGGLGEKERAQLKAQERAQFIAEEATA